MPHMPSRRSVIRWLADCLFVPLAVVFTVAGAALGCSGSVHINSNDPNRALGTFTATETITESASNVCFGYWLDGDCNIDPTDGQALQQAVLPIQCAARITIVPNSILYEETATETVTGRTLTVSISGTWTYDSQARIQANWGNAIVTDSTFSVNPPYTLAAAGTQVQDPQPNDLIIADSAWSYLTNVAPGPLNGVFMRSN